MESETGTEHPIPEIEKTDKVKKKNRPTGIKHRKSLLHQFIFYQLFDTIYNPHVDENGEIIWKNTVESLEKMFQTNDGSTLLLGAKPNKANIRNILCGYYDKGNGVLERFSDAHNKYGFYPKETEEGFERYIDMISETTDKQLLEKRRNSNVQYFHVCFNRQFILMMMRKAGFRFKFKFKMGDRRFEAVLPVVGRYRKIYEMTDVMDDYLDRMRIIRDLLRSGDAVSLKDIEEILIEQEEFLDKISDMDLDSKTADRMADDLDGYIKFLTDRKEDMEFLRSQSEYGSFKEDFRFRDRFLRDREYVFRREAIWEDMVVDGEDLSVFTNTEFYEITDGERILLRDTDLIRSFTGSYG